jgi:hypothetical protein
MRALFFVVLLSIITTNALNWSMDEIANTAFLADEVLTSEVSGWRSRKVCVAGATAVFAFVIIGTFVASASMRQASVGVNASAMSGFIDSDCRYDHPDASHEVLLAFETASMCTYRGDTCNCGNWLYKERNGVFTVENLFE